MSFGEPVGVIRPTTTTDRYGNAARVYGATATHTVDGCAFDPGGSTEINDGRNAVTTTPTLYLPVGADVEAADKVIVRGTVYEVVGDSAVWVDPFGSSLGGVTVELRKVDG